MASVFLGFSLAKKFLYWPLRQGVIVIASILLVVGVTFIVEACEQKLFLDTAAVVFSGVTATLLITWSIVLLSAVATVRKVSAAQSGLSMFQLQLLCGSYLLQSFGLQLLKVLFFLVFMTWIIASYGKELENKIKSQETNERPVFVIVQNMNIEDIRQYSKRRSSVDDIGIIIFKNEKNNGSLYDNNNKNKNYEEI